MFKPLRDKILELAITGKLVPQMDSEPAVEQIGPAPAKEEEPFALPEKWKWVRLEYLSLASFSGGTPSKDKSDYWNGSIPWASIKDLSVDSEELSATKDHITAKGLANSSTKLVEANNVIVGMRMGLNKVVINTIPLAINQDLRAFYLDCSLIAPKFFVKFYRTLKFEGAGTTVKGIRKDELMGMFVPLPPLEEQRRIVSKLDDIMGNLERMDQAYTELSGPMLKHFKNLVLQQAISGQLVPQLDSEPAVEQLGPAHKPEEVPFAIPEKWKWVALEDLFQFVDYRGKTPIKSASGVRLITSSNVRKGYLDHTRCEYISIDEYQSRQSRGVSHKGDILFTTEAPLGNVALADLDVFSVGQRVITLKSKGLALNECFVWFLLSNYFQTEILKQATGSTVQGIKAARLKKLVLPLPPIEEQKRIAARINKLFAEADKLLALKELSL